MSNHNQIIVLGTGTSTGVPIVGCQCEVCLSTNPKNKRYRSSIVIKTKDNEYILVDTTPDLRSQLIENNITQVDFTIITHEHADHVHGIDDLRPLCFWQKSSIPVFTNHQTQKALIKKFDYIFDRGNDPVIGGGIPELNLNQISPETKQVIGQQEFYFTELPHGYVKTLSFIHSKMAYIVDCNAIPKDYLDKLRAQELEVLIIDCAKRDAHDTHLHLAKTLDYIKMIKPKFAGLTHLGHDFDHDALKKELKEQNLDYIVPLFDGQILDYQ